MIKWTIYIKTFIVISPLATEYIFNKNSELLSIEFTGIDYSQTSLKNLSFISKFYSFDIWFASKSMIASPIAK